MVAFALIVTYFIFSIRDDHQKQLKALKEAVERLNAKVYRLEKKAGIDPFETP